MKKMYLTTEAKDVLGGVLVRNAYGKWYTHLNTYVPRKVYVEIAAFMRAVCDAVWNPTAQAFVSELDHGDRIDATCRHGYYYGVETPQEAISVRSQVEPTVIEQSRCHGCAAKFTDENDGTFSYGARNKREDQRFCSACSGEIAKFIGHLRSKRDWYSSEWD